MSAADDLAEACGALIGAGVEQAELERALDEAAELPESDAGILDALIVFAWLAGAPIGELAPVLRRAWARGDACAVRERLARIRNGHVLAAAAARKAKGIDSADLQRQVDELVATGQARGKLHAYEILSERLDRKPSTLRDLLKKRRNHDSATGGTTMPPLPPSGPGWLNVLAIEVERKET